MAHSFAMALSINFYATLLVYLIEIYHVLVNLYSHNKLKDPNN